MILVLVLAALNIGFSLVDPILFGKLINLANRYRESLVHKDVIPVTADEFFNSFSWGGLG